MSEKGDQGITQGECCLSVSKDSVFVETVGTIDRFQARLGWARVEVIDDTDKKNIFQIEKDLNEVMSSLYVGKNWDNGARRIEEISGDAELIKNRVKNIEGFLIPGENEIESRLNICRTDCREAERRVVSLKLEREGKEGLELDQNVLKYFNRLSYLLNWMWRSSFNEVK